MEHIDSFREEFLEKTFIVVTAFIAPAAVFGLFANAALIYSVLRQPGLRRSPTYLTLVSLAVSDFFSLTTQPIFLSLSPSKDLGLSLCSWVLFAGQAGISCSAFHLMAFSVMRYLTLVKPLFSMRYLTIKTTIATCAVIWIVSLVISAGSFTYIQIMPHNTSFNQTVNICAFKSTSSPYIIAALIVIVFIPMATLGIFHIAKVCKLRKRPVTAVSGQRSQVSTKIVVGILIVFGMSSLPNGVYWVIMFSRTEISLEMTALGYALASLSYINSAVNPVFYFFFSDRVRKDIYCLRCPPKRGRANAQDAGSLRRVTSCLYINRGEMIETTTEV